MQQTRSAMYRVESRLLETYRIHLPIAPGRAGCYVQPSSIAAPRSAVASGSGTKTVGVRRLLRLVGRWQVQYRRTCRIIGTAIRHITSNGPQRVGSSDPWPSLYTLNERIIAG